VVLASLATPRATGIIFLSSAWAVRLPTLYPLFPQLEAYFFSKGEEEGVHFFLFTLRVPADFFLGGVMVFFLSRNRPRWADSRLPLKIFLCVFFAFSLLVVNLGSSGGRVISLCSPGGSMVFLCFFWRIPFLSAFGGLLAILVDIS